MEPNNEEFDQLRKLLELKRHEAPPPGYFEDFSSSVIARIEAEDARAGSAWWRRLFPGVETSPLMVGAYSVIAASLVIAGVQLAGNSKSPDGVGSGNDLAGSGVSAPQGPELQSPILVPVGEESSPIVAQPAAIAVVNELENTARSAPTGMFDPPSLYTSKVERVAFPQNQ